MDKFVRTCLKLKNPDALDGKICSIAKTNILNFVSSSTFEMQIFVGNGLKGKHNFDWKKIFKSKPLILDTFDVRLNFYL